MSPRFILFALTGLTLASVLHAASLPLEPAAPPTTAAAAEDKALVTIAPPNDGSKKEEPSKIDLDADSMELDMAARTSTFVGNVRVQEPRMTLTADKMIVYFSKEDKPERIECLGNVIIEQPGDKRQAKAGRAEYIVAEGKIVLTEDPEVLIGSSSLKNMIRIIYYRDSGKIVTEGRSNINMETQGSTAIPGIAPKGKKP